MSEYRGYYELAPSGGIDASSFEENFWQSQIEKELEEEAGIPRSFISNFEILCFLYDNKHFVFDIVVKMVLSCEVDLKKVYSEEYEEFSLIDIKNLADFLENKKIVPVSKRIIDFL